MAPLGIRHSEGEHDPIKTTPSINLHPRDATLIGPFFRSNTSVASQVRGEVLGNVATVHLSRRSSSEGTIIGIAIAAVIILILVLILAIHFKCHKGEKKPEKSKKTEKEKKKEKEEKEKKEKEKKEKKKEEEEKERKEKEEKERRRKRRERRRRKENQEILERLEKNQWREQERKRMRRRRSGEMYMVGGAYSQPMMVPMDGQMHPRPYGIPTAMDAPQDMPPDAVYYADMNYGPVPASVFGFRLGVPPGGSRMPAESPICTDFNCSGSSSATDSS